MDRDNIIVLKYQDNFADNLSSIAYALILKNKFAINYFWENDLKQRTCFENLMSNFNLDYSFVSKTRVDLIRNRIVQENDFTNKFKKDKFLNINHFKIDDIDKITNDIKEMFCFKDVSFIKNFDILEDIVSNQSIGLYVNKFDFDINYDFISKATKRLNKYIKNPVLFVFSSSNFELKTDINYKTIQLNDWMEEFYFLTQCKHKIILSSIASYSEGLWSAILNENDLNYVIYEKNNKCKNKKRNWIAI